MFQSIVSLILAGIFLQAQAVNPSVSVVPGRSLALQNQNLEIKAPTKISDYSSLGVKVTARSFMVVEPETGAVLYEKNSQEPRSIASITKLMTALVFLEYNPGWDSEYTITQNDFRAGAVPSLNVGEKVKVRDLFYAMMVASSNEAAAALAYSTGLSEKEFIDQMNLRAYLLEMNNTTFADPTGLDSNNKSTAENLIKLIDVAFSHSEVRKAAGTKSYEVNILNKNAKRVLISTDKILKDEFGFKNDIYRLEAGKTGYLDSAGYCFASQVRDQNGRRLLIAVLGSSSTYDRFTDTKSLAYWVFNNFKW